MYEMDSGCDSEPSYIHIARPSGKRVVRVTESRSEMPLKVPWREASGPPAACAESFEAVR